MCHRIVNKSVVLTVISLEILYVYVNSKDNCHSSSYSVFYNHVNINKHVKEQKIHYSGMFRY